MRSGKTDTWNHPTRGALAPFARDGTKPQEVARPSAARVFGTQPIFRCDLVPAPADEEGDAF
jgi:hypothetical protein